MFLAAIAIAALCVFLGDGDEYAGTAHGVTTETIAAAAGARVPPTDPKLKVEPK